MFDQILADMFVLSVPWIEKILRPVIIYLFLVVCLRVAGRRELAQLNPFDLIALLTLANTVQNAIIGDDNSVSGGIIGAAALLATNYVVVRLSYENRAIERLVEGQPVPLIDGGRVDARRLRREMITREELMATAQKQGIRSLDDVESAMLE